MPCYHPPDGKAFFLLILFIFDFTLMKFYEKDWHLRKFI
jgi:hypothetical protein